MYTGRWHISFQSRLDPYRRRLAVFIIQAVQRCDTHWVEFNCSTHEALDYCWWHRQILFQMSGESLIVSENTPQDHWLSLNIKTETHYFCLTQWKAGTHTGKYSLQQRTLCMTSFHRFSHKSSTLPICTADILQPILQNFLSLPPFFCLIYLIFTLLFTYGACRNLCETVICSHGHLCQPCRRAHHV